MWAPITDQAGTRNDFLSTEVTRRMMPSIFTARGNAKFRTQLEVDGWEDMEPDEQIRHPTTNQIVDIFQKPLRMPVSRQGTNSLMLKLPNARALVQWKNILKQK